MLLRRRKRMPRNRKFGWRARSSTAVRSASRRGPAAPRRMMGICLRSATTGARERARCWYSTHAAWPMGRLRACRSLWRRRKAASRCQATPSRGLATECTPHSCRGWRQRCTRCRRRRSIVGGSARASSRTRDDVHSLSLQAKVYTRVWIMQCAL